MDRSFLFNTIKTEVELLLRKEGLLNGISFSMKSDICPESPFNIIIESDAPIQKFIGESHSENPIKENMENIFEKYEQFSEIVDNTLYILPF